MDSSDTRNRMEGFSVVFGLAEVAGALAVTLVAAWIGYFRGGFAWSSDPGAQFNWHPMLMTVGMVFLYANSIMVYRAFPNNRKHNLKISHAALHFAVFILAVIGLQAVFDFHNVKGIPNLYSLHSWIGLAAVILFSFQWLAGLVTFLFPGLKPVLRGLYLPVHVYFGIMGFICAILSSLLGLLEKATFVLPNYGELPPEGVLINSIGLVLVVFGCLVLYIVTEPRFKRQPRPEDEILLTGSLE